jgi:hypothetical protein
LGGFLRVLQGEFATDIAVGLKPGKGFAADTDRKGNVIKGLQDSLL